MRSADTGCAQQGFTLIEVLAALIIVSLGMLGVIEAVSQTASNGSYLRDKTLAHWIAMNQLTQTRLAQQAPKVDETSDEIEMGERRWRWTMKVAQTPLDSVRRIDVSVRLADGDEKSSLASLTGFYGTAIAQPGTTLVLWQGSASEQQDGRNGGRNGGKRENDANNPAPRSEPENNPPSQPQPQSQTPPGEQTSEPNG